MGTKIYLGYILLNAVLILANAGLVRNILRPRRQVPAPSKDYNLTLPSTDQAVVFNHVYNINVPASSLCSVDLDAQGDLQLESKDSRISSGLSATEHTVNKENQIVFTHRINIPQQSCDCTNGLPDLKELLNRLEMLEGEVSSLREQCSNNAQVTGDVGTKPYCNGHGNYSSEACSCRCDPGWNGPNCTERACPSDCHGHGLCVHGKCECYQGFTGEDCTQAECPVDCGKNGQCLGGSCVCSEGYAGEDCMQAECPVDCGKNGQCLGGSCVCSEGYAGEDCMQAECPVDCGKNGQCLGGSCVCSEGFVGEDCTQALCPVDCGKNGQCLGGSCVCSEGYAGEDCMQAECPVDCGRNGQCVGGACVCSEGYAGEDCTQAECPVDCGKNRQCVDGACVCSAGYAGEDCTQNSCPNNCLGRGRCVDGECECDEPWTGFDCSELICPKDCYDRGRCVNGTCHCENGYSGDDCGVRTCKNNCQSNGFCVDGQCICSAGYGGEDCSKPTCLNDCSSRGACINGMCVCDSGHQGEDCSQLACHNDCNNRGTCINGQCACDVGFTGEDCSELACPNSCLNRGRCVNGQCVCDEGFADEDCSVMTCPSACHGRGRCVSGKCICYAGFTGEDCSELSCPNNCQNHGRCMDGQCVCDEGFSGNYCEKAACPNDCLARGYCLDGKCVCREGYSGEDCSVFACPDDCNNRGRCVGAKCICEAGYEGEQCEQRTCLNNCQGKGSCVKGQCVCEEGYIGEDCSEVSPPKDLTVANVSTATVDLSWKNEMLVTEYLVTYVPTSPGGLYQEFTVPGDKSAATVKELEPGIEYLINVYAVLSNKRSIPVSARVATYLPQPEGLRFKSVEDTSVEVLWDQLDISFDGWELFFRNTKEENGKISNTLPSYQTRFDQSGLGPGQEYEVSISVIKNNTRGPETLKRFTTKIDAPRQVEVQHVTDSSALVIWSQPEALVDGVTLSYGPSTDPSDRTMVELSTIDKQYGIHSLTPDTEYQISLVSKRRDFTSNPVIKAFTTDLDSPRDVKVLSHGDDTITLEWSNSLADVETYRVKYSPLSGASHGEKLFPQGPGDTTQATITGLKPGTEYGIGVTAVKNERESLPATTNAATDLDAPDNLIAEITETSLSLAWQRPRAKFASYKLVYVSRDGHREELEVPASAVSHVLTGLTPGTVYNITLTAERGEQKSSPASLTASTASFTFYLADSDDHELMTPAGSEDNIISFAYLDISDTQLSGTGPGGELGALTVSGLTSDGFDLSWEPQPQGVYDRFTVECRDTRRLWGVKEFQQHGDATGSRIRGLKASTEYEIKLYGITNNKRSALLEAVAVTAPEPTSPDVIASFSATPTAAPRFSLDLGPVQTTVSLHSQNDEGSLLSQTSGLGSGVEPEGSGPDALGNLTVTKVTSTSVELAWSARSEAFDRFMVGVSDRSGATRARVTTVRGSDRKAELKGLSPSTHYAITLHGLVEGEKSLRLKVFATTEELNPKVVNLTISDITWDSFNVSWSPKDGDFESFVIEVTNMENIAESQNLTLSGDAFSLLLSGLIPNTSYTVALYGMHQGSVLEPLYTGATTVNQPMIGNLYVSNVTSESFTISWNGTGRHFDGYTLDIIDSDWLRGAVEYNISYSAMSHDVTGLNPSTDYVAYLYGILKGSRTKAVSIVASTAAEPDLSRLVVSNITSDRFSLSWSTREKAFDIFIVEVRESALPSQAMGRTLPGDARSTLMAGLKARTSYNIKLYGSAGGRNALPLFAVATTEDAPLLGPVSASSVSPDNLTLTWTAVSGHFDGFVIRVSDSEQRFDTLEFRLPGEVLNITVANLMDATGYDIELYGISHGRRTSSVFSHAVTAPLPKVENLTVSNITPYGFHVSWEMKQQQPEGAPSSGGFSHFQVVVTDSGWLLEPQQFTVPGNQNYLDIWGLITGIGYEIRLTGMSRSGLLSRPLTAVAVTEAEPEIEHLFVSDVMDDSFRLSWTADEDLFDRFVVKIRDTKKLAHPQEYNVLGDKRTKVLTGLMGGTEYEIELYGVTSEQRSQPITTIAQTGLGTPKGLRFSEVIDTSAIVEWAVPRAQVDNYHIIYVPVEGGSPLSVSVDGTVSQALLPNMAPGTAYRVTVTAVKGLEESDPTTDTVTTALDRPQGLTAVNVTDGSALLLWQPSVATVEGYVITYRADSVSPVTKHVSGNIVEFEMGSLAPATHYTVGVHGMRSTQKSPPATTEFTTEVDPPRDLAASNIQTDGATLTWGPPRAAITGYTLTSLSADGAIREVVLSPTATSYSMTQLSSSTQYNVRLQAMGGAQRSDHVHTVFTTNSFERLYEHPKDCAQIFLNGETSSGQYTIYVGGKESQSILVYCDMTTDGGGWTVFLRRQNGKVEFFRNWKNYTAGFGNVNDEFWLGLSNLHQMTSSGQYELRVDLRDHGESAYALYDKFTVGEPRKRYKVNVGEYSGTAGDAMTYHQGRPFSTYDHDNDIAITNCALSYSGAFWYKNCHRANLMGKYNNNNHSKGINWFHWKGHEHSIPFAEMKIRPADFRNFESRRKRL